MDTKEVAKQWARDDLSQTMRKALESLQEEFEDKAKLLKYRLESFNEDDDVLEQMTAYDLAMCDCEQLIGWLKTYKNSVELMKKQIVTHYIK